MCHGVPGGRGLVDGTVGPGLEDDLINSHRLLTQHHLTVVLNKISLFKLVCGPKEKHFFKGKKIRGVIVRKQSTYNFFQDQACGWSNYKKL
jgi:hypothetical protein